MSLISTCIMKMFFICKVTFHRHLPTVTVLGRPVFAGSSGLHCSTVQTLQFLQARPLHPLDTLIIHPVMRRVLTHWGTLVLGTILPLYSLFESEWLWRSHKAVFTGVVKEIFPYISWEEFFISIFIICFHVLFLGENHTFFLGKKIVILH